MRSGSVRPMCWWNPIVTAPCDTGALQVAGVMSTWSGSLSVNAPLLRYTGPAALSAASPAVETDVRGARAL